MDRPKPLGRTAYRWFFETQMRWADTDVYGHMNNVRHHEYFDTALGMALITHGALTDAPDEPIGLVARNEADYFAEIVFPARIAVGVRVERIGRTSLTWGFGLFADEAATTAARGRFVHVYVSRKNRRPAPLSEALLACANALLVEQT